MNRKYLTIIGILVLISFIYAIQINTFDNGLNAENLTFIRNENHSREITLYRYANVTSAFMNFSGFQEFTYDDFEDSSVNSKLWINGTNNDVDASESTGTLRFGVSNSWTAITTNFTFKELGYNFTMDIYSKIASAGFNEIFFRNDTSNVGGGLGFKVLKDNVRVNITLIKNNESSIDIYENYIYNRTINVSDTVGDVNDSRIYIRGNWGGKFKSMEN